MANPFIPNSLISCPVNCCNGSVPKPLLFGGVPLALSPDSGVSPSSRDPSRRPALTGSYTVRVPDDWFAQPSASYRAHTRPRSLIASQSLLVSKVTSRTQKTLTLRAKLSSKTVEMMPPWMIPSCPHNARPR